MGTNILGERSGLTSDVGKPPPTLRSTSPWTQVPQMLKDMSPLQSFWPMAEQSILRIPQQALQPVTVLSEQWFLWAMTALRLTDPLTGVTQDHQRRIYVMIHDKITVMN